MKHDRPSESDWKKFRTIVPELWERYLCERNSEAECDTARRIVDPDESILDRERAY